MNENKAKIFDSDQIDTDVMAAILLEIVLKAHKKNGTKSDVTVDVIREEFKNMNYAILAKRKTEDKSQIDAYFIYCDKEEDVLNSQNSKRIKLTTEEVLLCVENIINWT